jgi:hypothetical protein
VNFAAFVAVGIWGFASGNIFFGIVFLIFLLLWVWFFFSVRPFIPFVGQLLSTVASLVSAYPSTQLTAGIALIVQALWVMFWAYTVMLVQHRFSDVAIKAMSFFLTLSFYWTFQVIRNVCHVTNSGVRLLLYFFFLGFVARSF